MRCLSNIYIYFSLIFLFSLPIAYAQPATTYIKSASLWSTANNRLKPIHLAVANRDLSELNRLIQQKANVNSKDQNGHTPLHWAAYYGYEDCIHLLIAHKAIITNKSKQGATPLHIATLSCHLPAVKLFTKEKKALSIKEKYGYNPIHIAAQIGQIDCLNFC